MKESALLLLSFFSVSVLATVVQTLDSAIHRINHYPADSLVGFPNTYPRDSDLSCGYPIQRLNNQEQVAMRFTAETRVCLKWKISPLIT